MNIYTLSPSKVKDCVTTCMQARLVPFLISSPGMGKSSIVKQIADEYSLKLIDCRLSSMDPVDLNGLPWIQEGKARFNPYEMFPLENTEIPEGYEGWILFLDEFNSASRAVQAAAYRVVLDREIGQHKLHPKCFVVAAGNKSTDNAIVNRLSTAMLSRVIHLNMEINFEDWRYNYAIPNNVDDRVIAYLSMFPNSLMSFDPERDDQTFACPRTWDFVSRLLKAWNRSVDESVIPLLAGAVSLEQASSFVQFCKVYKDLITLDDLKKNPSLTPPSNGATLWAIITHLSSHICVEDMKTVREFISKCPATFQIVFCRSVIKRLPGLGSNKDFIELTANVGEYCFGD